MFTFLLTVHILAITAIPVIDTLNLLNKQLIQRKDKTLYELE